MEIDNRNSLLARERKWNEHLEQWSRLNEIRNNKISNKYEGK